jgi:hypothetical protein
LPSGPEALLAGGQREERGLPLLTKGDEGGLDQFLKALKCYPKAIIFSHLDFGFHLNFEL